MACLSSPFSLSPSCNQGQSLWFHLIAQLENALISSSQSRCWQHSVPKCHWAEDRSFSLTAGQRPSSSLPCKLNCLAVSSINHVNQESNRESLLTVKKSQSFIIQSQKQDLFPCHILSVENKLCVPPKPRTWVLVKTWVLRDRKHWGPFQTSAYHISLVLPFFLFSTFNFSLDLFRYTWHIICASLKCTIL